MRKVIFGIILSFVALSFLHGEVGETESSPSQMRAGDTGGGYKNAKDFKNAEFNGNDSTHPLAPSAREGESMALSSAREGEQMSESAESLNAKMGESSGIILGLGISYHNFRFTQNYEKIVSEIKQTGKENVSTTTTATQLEPPINLKAGSGGGSIMFGYQGLSAPFSEMVQLGIRVYGDLSATKIHFSDNIAPTMLRYGLNADMLLDFILGQNLWLGLFAGVRIGGTSYLGDDINAINKRLTALNNGSFPKSSFDFAVNVGLRTNITQNSGVELVFAIPVYQMKYKASSEKVEKTKTNTTTTTTTTATSLSGAFKEQWSASVRYVWAFSTK